jgi:uncharacterized protein (DUF924 family)
MFTKPEPVNNAARIITFWQNAGPEKWFAKDLEFDREFRDSFANDFAAASCGQYNHWLDTAEGALALVILLDQYPRNSFRDTLWMYVTDTAARIVANIAIEKGYDFMFEGMLPLFFYLPFSHSELLADQQRAAALCQRFGEPSISHAERHLGIIQRFGRFPHRNHMLSRKMRPEEEDFLFNGGFSG